jgi:hypothetical protein
VRLGLLIGVAVVDQTQLAGFKCSDFLGNEVKVGDSIVVAKSNKNLRLTKVADIEVEWDINTKIWKIGLASELITTKPLYNRGKEIVFTLQFYKYYKTEYFKRHGVKFKRIYKVC